MDFDEIFREPLTMGQGTSVKILVLIWITDWSLDSRMYFLSLHSQTVLEILGLGGGMYSLNALVSYGTMWSVLIMRRVRNLKFARNLKLPPLKP